VPVAIFSFCKTQQIGACFFSLPPSQFEMGLGTPSSGKKHQRIAGPGLLPAAKGSLMQIRDWY
jgi:hypothetical protein